MAELTQTSGKDFPNSLPITREIKDDPPLQVGNTARRSCGGPAPVLTELTTLSDLIPSEQIAKSWELNYREAAIFIEEGANNDKFSSHPRSHEALPVYLLVHNHWYYSLDFLFSLLLLSLAFVEKPANPLFQLPVGIHASIEITALFVVAVELIMKYKWIGFMTFVKHPRTVVKAITLIIMLVEALVVLVRQSSHFRVTRALRPIFFVDNRYCGGIRRYLRQVLQSLPPAVDMLGLLLFVMLFYSVLGFYLFGDTGDPYFSTLQDSFISLFILLTTANFPDVMMPSYAMNRWSAAFFVSYLVTVLYFLMNLMLAAVYAAFSAREKEKFKRLLLHKRKACQHAFRLLLSRNSKTTVTWQHFKGLLRYVQPNKSIREVYLTFKTLNISKTGCLSLDEFYGIYDALALKWQPTPDTTYWFQRSSFVPETILKLARGLNSFIVSWAFEYIVCSVILISGLLLLIRTADISGHHSLGILQMGATWESWVFIGLYTFEVMLKMVAYGPHRYFQSGWNLFDFCVTFTSVIGLIAESAGYYSIVVVRHLRLLRVFKLKKRYRDVFGSVFILAERLVSAGMVLLILYYSFAIVGMELFADYDMTNCCQNSTVEANFVFNNQTQGYYYLNNFHDLVSSYVTLFELTVVNNWYILMEAYAVTVSQWCRIFFMSFYLLTMVFLSIVVASVLEGFLFRIQYKAQMSKEEETRLVEKEVELTCDELDFLTQQPNPRTWLFKLKTAWRKFKLFNFSSLSEDYGPQENQTFVGHQSRTKEILQAFMYREEIAEWFKTAAVEDERQSLHSHYWNHPEGGTFIS